MITMIFEIGRLAIYLLPLLMLILPVFAKAQTVVIRTNEFGQTYMGTVPAFDSAQAISKDLSTKAKKLFSQVSNVLVAGYSVNTDYSIKGAISGTDTIKANTPMGTTIVGLGAGNFTTATLNIGAITVKVFLSGVLVLTNTFSSLPINVASQSPYQSKITLTVRTGSVAADGYIDFAPVNGLGAVKMPFPTTVTPIDWTTDKIFDVKIQYSNAGNSLTSINQTLLQY